MTQLQIRRRAARSGEPEATDATPPARRPATPTSDGVAELLGRIDAAVEA